MRHLLILLTALFLIASCDSNSGSEKSFDRGEILTQTADVLILPTYEDLVSKMKSLDQSAQSFIDEPNADGLEVLMHSHLEARLSWKTAEAFNFGPVDDLALATQMDFWPVNTVGVEEEISEYNASEIGNKILPSNKKGLAAIEYLLFQNGLDETLIKFEEEGRKGMLVYYTKDLLELSQAIQKEWTEGDYYDAFITSTGQDVTAGATLLANEMIMLAERIQMARIGKPLGLTSFEDPNPAYVESLYAQKSLLLIQANIEIIQQVFNGADGQGFDDYLNSLSLANEGEDPLSITINTQIETCLSSQAAINGPLQEAIISNPDQVEDLYEDVSTLIVLLKSDMMSQLGLTVIFGDSDGD